MQRYTGCGLSCTRRSPNCSPRQAVSVGLVSLDLTDQGFHGLQFMRSPAVLLATLNISVGLESSLYK